jgi:death-on-curing protein
MAMNLRLTDSETAALRKKAAEEGRSMQEVARTAIALYTSDRPTPCSDRPRPDRGRGVARPPRAVTVDDAVDYLSVDDLLEIAEGILPGVEVRDYGLLASAAARPRTSVFGSDAYEGLEKKAAALLHSIVRNHALVDGNKRLGWAAMRAFLLLNGCDVSLTVDAAEALVVGAADGSLSVDQLADVLAKAIR